jgi:hypothetical protein
MTRPTNELACDRLNLVQFDEGLCRVIRFYFIGLETPSLR